MKISFVSPRLYYYFKPGEMEGAGGAERQQYFLSKGLAERGHDVSVVTQIFGSVGQEHHDGVDVYQLIPDTSHIALFPFKLLWMLLVLGRLDADVYYVRGHPNFCFVMALFSRLTGRGFIYVVANDSDVEPGEIDQHGRVFKHLYLWAIREADRVVTLTPYQRDLLCDEYDINAVTIPCGYDSPPPSEVPSQIQRKYFLWVGRFDPRHKQPERFIEAAKKLPEIKFVMVGPPIEGEESYFNRLKRDASKVPNLRFEGFVSPDEIDEYYKHAKALVNTSVSEGFGNVLLEAWRYATPVIALEYSLHGVIEQESVGVYAGDFERMVTAIQELDENPDRRTGLGTGGLAYLEEHYSMSSVLDRTEQAVIDAAGVVNDR